MKLVYEALENEQLVRMIPDNGTAPLYFSVQLVPTQAVIGDVFELTQTADCTTLTLLPHEKEARLNDLKAKRAALLNRNK
ncbi:hypothetical protein [Isobaculum melis]|uniref:DUF3006 domain-containing protein n=1 Tax=Isobaculum melis TaxID=142588 RepID=A0A1H9T942_9LACT|nr:hypothetical protein [Isobaculum melis]SER93722.1 hypothetical protein SAMN04488559_11173 [Isobaculum melis]